MLKFAGIKVGSKIRAYDFKPMSDRPDSFVEGVITAAGMVPEGGMAYTIDVTADSVFESGGRTVVHVPMQVAFLEYDNRIEVLETV